jgi:general secretion pathway protein E
LSTNSLENLDNKSNRWSDEATINDQSESGFLLFLINRNLIDSIAADRARQLSISSNKPLVLVIIEFGFLEDDVLVESLCAFTSLPRFNVNEIEDAFLQDQSLSRSFLLNNHICPFSQNDKSIKIAISNPLFTQAAKAIAFALSLDLLLFVATPSEIDKLIVNSFETTTEQLISTELPLSETDKERLRDFASDAPIIKLLNLIVLRAVEAKASDIHIEPFEDRTRIRFRVDGVLRSFQEIDKSAYLGVVSRVKILSHLNIAESRLPQDGRMQLAVRGRNVEFRVATSPSVNGEAVVLRLLDRNSKILGLEELGFATETISRIDNVLRQPNGMFLVSGPTGSGKTTTLYAALLRLNNPTRKIFTIEDPVEYQIKGVTQINIRPQIGLDFAHVLRSVLRQDPDVILVGEIRDRETAQIAVQASLTGHLVLSTIHTNSSAATITRLRNLGIENHLIASSIRAVLAQRLVRRSCAQCSPTNPASTCKHCDSTGFSGRTTLSEHLEFDSIVTGAVSAGENETRIASNLTRQRADTLQQSGDRLVRLGVTMRAEIDRVLITS